MKKWGTAAALSLALIAMGVALALWLRGSMLEAAVFSPTLDVGLSDDTAAANADVTSDLDAPDGDANYDLKIAFTPAEFGLGAGMPLGAHVADMHWLITLGLLNQPCTTTLETTFNMLNASVDTSQEVTFEESYGDSNSNQLPDGVDKYPDFLNRMFPGLTPTARWFAVVSVGGKPFTLNIVFFDPGTTLHGVPFDSGLGRPSVHVFNDWGDPDAVPTPDAITDFCPPLTEAVMTFGVSKDNPDTAADESRHVVSTNPVTPGDHTFTVYTTSLRDADDDGLDNSLDTCPYDVNAGTDTDNDGLDNACDPDPETATTDWDDDDYLNAGDNCPLAPNGPEDDNQADTDGDTIGDACDASLHAPDGASIELYLTDTVTIDGDATPTPEPTPTPTPTPAGDDFADAGVITSLCYTYEADTSGMTLEPGEPQPWVDMGATVWYQYTAATTEWLAANTMSSDFDTVLAVYTGPSVDDLILVAANDDRVGLQSVVEFEATAGSSYYFQVGGFWGATGNLHFELCPYCTPVIPGTYVGDIVIDGEPAPDGTTVSALIEGIEWATTSTSGGRYVIDVPQSLPVEPPCFWGGRMEFYADGILCSPILQWASGLQDDFNLTCDLPGDCYTMTWGVSGREMTGPDGVVVANPSSSGGCAAYSYSPGTVVELTAFPAAGREWSRWSGTDDNDLNPTTITMNSNRSVAAYFKERDSDDDAFTDPVEMHLGTDLLDDCPDDLGSPGLCPGPSCDGHDAWPPDLDVDRQADISDVLKFKPLFLAGFPCNQDAEYDRRFDFNASHCINIADVLLYKPVILSECTNP